MMVDQATWVNFLSSVGKNLITAVLVGFFPSSFNILFFEKKITAQVLSANVLHFEKSSKRKNMATSECGCVL